MVKLAFLRNAPSLFISNSGLSPPASLFIYKLVPAISCPIIAGATIPYPYCPFGNRISPTAISAVFQEFFVNARVLLINQTCLGLYVPSSFFLLPNKPFWLIVNSWSDELIKLFNDASRAPLIKSLTSSLYVSLQELQSSDSKVTALTVLSRLYNISPNSAVLSLSLKLFPKISSKLVGSS